MPFKAGESLEIGNRKFRSRLIFGTAQFSDHEVMLESLEESGAELITVAIRRYSGEKSFLFSLLKKYTCIPNTAGCYTAKEAVITAELAREVLGTDLVKLEVIADDKTLLPHPVELLKAAEELVEKGFVVLPFSPDDPIICKQLERIGCAAVMPLGSPIGSGRGIQNAYNIQMIRDLVKVPVLIDAGIGCATDVTQAMELGVDGVLVNSAIARADNPPQMARAMRTACLAGRDSFEAGRIPKRFYAKYSTPLEGRIEV